jgi:hypothetical protein
MDKEKLKEIGGNRSAQVAPDSINPEARTVEFIISTEAVDTYGTVFKMDGWELDRYLSNPVVFYQHRSYSDNPDMVVGTSEIRKEGDKLIGRVTFEPEGENELADKVFRKIDRGTLRGASISALPKSARWGDPTLEEDPEVLYFTRHELLEWSITPMPSNGEALARQSRTMAELRDGREQPQGPPEPTPDPNTNSMSRYEAQVYINQNHV